MRQAINQSKLWLQDIFLNSHAQQTRMRDAAIAKSLGLPEQEYARAFPATMSSTQTTVNQGAGLLKTGLLSAAMLAAGAGATAWLGKGVPPTADKPPVATKPAQDLEVILERQNPEGGWDVIAKQPLPKDR